MKTCVVVGSGRCVWDDLERAEDIIGMDVMCINDIGMHYPGVVTHWYSNDAVMLGRWALARRPGLPTGTRLHTNNGAGGPVGEGMRVWEWVHGNSGINAVKTAFALGYDRVVICGMPLDDKGHYFDPPCVTTNYNNNSTLDDWVKYAVDCKEKVTVMSGNLKEIFGNG